MRKIFLTLIIAAWLVPVKAQELTNATKVTINTSGPIQYEHSLKENPPAIVIEFKSRNVFSYWEGVMVVNKGAIKEIHTEYYATSRPSAPQALKALTFILAQKSAYNISQTENAIVIEVENPSTQLPSGEIIIPGILASELEMQKKRDSRQNIFGNKAEIKRSRKT